LDLSSWNGTVVKIKFLQGQRGITGGDLRMIAMTKVIEGTVFTIEVTNVGDVYSKLAKYKLGPKLTLQRQTS
jgi:hypothetical protein